MPQLLFLMYISVLGFVFSLCFKKWIPIRFLSYGSFLWGSVLFSSILILTNIIGIKSSLPILMAIMVLSLVIPVVIIIKTRLIITKEELWIFFQTFIPFSLLNILFITFNFTLATLDSFTILRLSRSVTFWGFNQNAIEHFSSWGVFIPILQSVSEVFNTDYLVSLQFSFAFSFLLVFYYSSKHILQSLLLNKKIAKPLAIIGLLLLISTPIFIVQIFYIHGTLTTGIFIYIAIISFLLSITENNNYWLVFFLLSVIGVFFSRAETFIYVDILLLLIIISNRFPYKSRLFCLIPIILLQLGWFSYMFIRLDHGAKLLNPQRIFIVIVALLLMLIITILSRYKFIENIFLNFRTIYLLITIFLAVIILYLLRPDHISTSIFSFLSNTFITGYWGISFWLIIPVLLIPLFEKNKPMVLFISFFVFSIIGVFFVMVFFRNPYHLYWTDSSNRLMTLHLPIGLLAVLITTGNWLDSVFQNQSKNTNNDI